jgi:hypothetical protein
MNKTMPYEIIWTDKGVVWEYSGLLNGADIIESNDRIYGDSRFDGLEYEIADLSRVTDFEVTDFEMRKMAHLDQAAARTNPRIRLAVVAPEGPAREIADAYQRYSSNAQWENAIFDTRAEAESWLKSV